MRRPLAFLVAVAPFLPLGVGLAVSCRSSAPPEPEPIAASTPPTLTNRLATSPSPYLRSAAEQPVHWQVWGSDAFELAKARDRPMLLDIGAAWCHWCHVIDRETYENPEIAAIINGSFVPVKVDRDERPDVDRRYQALLAALGRSGGWPLTAFLTPSGQMITGGTYFPPEDRGGSPGMKSILPRVAEMWRTDKVAIQDRATDLVAHVERFEREMSRPGELDMKILDQLDDALRGQFDSEHAGFGSPAGPKFPTGTLVGYALLRSQVTGDQEMKQMALRTIRAMSAGGVRDQLGGAFHRYSTDGAWMLPHFEVMASVNAEMIANAAQAFAATGDPVFREIAEEAIGYVDRVASDREHGGFFASQDADTGLDDDGGYWTWTKKEVEAAVSPDEAAALCLRYDVGDEGEMERTAHGAPDRNVLREAMSEEDVAFEMGRPRNEVHALLESGRRKLLETRSKRPAPAVDRSLIASLNGLLVVAYLDAADAFSSDRPREFALRSLDYFLDRAYRKGEGVKHTVLDGQARVPGLLDDQVQVALACTRAYEATGRTRYLEIAEDLARLLIDQYRDLERGGFFDRPAAATGPGVLSSRTKPIDDSPTPSGNGSAVLLLVRLHLHTEKSIYRERAEETLRAFARTVSTYGTFLATYGSALQLYLLLPPKVLVIGSPGDPAAKELLDEARRAFRPGKIALAVDPDRRKPGESLAYPADPKGRAIAYVCSGRTCGPPTNDPVTLRRLVETFGLDRESRSSGR